MAHMFNMARSSRRKCTIKSSDTKVAFIESRNLTFIIQEFTVQAYDILYSHLIQPWTNFVR